MRLLNNNNNLVKLIRNILGKIILCNLYIINIIEINNQVNIFNIFNGENCGMIYI